MLLDAQSHFDSFYFTSSECLDFVINCWTISILYVGLNSSKSTSEYGLLEMKLKYIVLIYIISQLYVLHFLNTGIVNQYV